MALLFTKAQKKKDERYIFFYCFLSHSFFLVTKQMIQGLIVIIPFVFPSFKFLIEIKMTTFFVFSA